LGRAAAQDAKLVSICNWLPVRTTDCILQAEISLRWATRAARPVHRIAGHGFYTWERMVLSDVREELDAARAAGSGLPGQFLGDWGHCLSAPPARTFISSSKPVFSQQLFAAGALAATRQAP
jgi:hypothetical protein